LFSAAVVNCFAGPAIPDELAGGRLLLMRAMDVSVGVAQPEEFTVTLNGNSYMTAEEHLYVGRCVDHLRRADHEDGVVV
jgi:hypothetical protein